MARPLLIPDAQIAIFLESFIYLPILIFTRPSDRLCRLFVIVKRVPIFSVFSTDSYAAKLRRYRFPRFKRKDIKCQVSTQTNLTAKD